MKLLGFLISLFTICLGEGVIAQPNPPERERTELDQVLEERGASSSVPRSDFYRYREPFLDTPHLHDFPRIAPPPPLGFPRPRYFYFDEVVPKSRPVVQVPNVNCSDWEKVHKRPGDVVIENGCRVVVQSESWTTSLGGIPVPAWANWYRYCNGSPQFSQ